ncbi:hypothetical protein [Mycobacterium uberis]|uniref:hypothetical protein n=1 Tax=Mycobacterium uberis TaxID=2162698 RepID=UPI000E3086E6|nr:hypothetical protein [Mycobacterium uberis]
MARYSVTPVVPYSMVSGATNPVLLAISGGDFYEVLTASLQSLHRLTVLVSEVLVFLVEVDYRHIASP